MRRAMAMNRAVSKRCGDDGLDALTSRSSAQWITDQTLMSHNSFWLAPESYLLQMPDFVAYDSEYPQDHQDRKRRKLDRPNQIYAAHESSSGLYMIPDSHSSSTTSGTGCALAVPLAAESVSQSDNAAVRQHRQSLRFDDHPFTEVSACRYKRLRERKVILDNSNSYIKLPTMVKVQLRAAAQRLPKHHPEAGLAYARAHHGYAYVPEDDACSHRSIPVTPPDMGESLVLDTMDKSLRNFYVKCMCPGRTLLPETNGWFRQLLPMADVDPIVHHALLAFSAGYCLEYLPHEKLLQRANDHYAQASLLLSRRLASGVETGYEDALVAALRLLWCDDIVQWEMRRQKSETPRWYQAVQMAKRIMRMTDAGYRYWHSEKRQCAPARISNANMLALIDIVASTVSRLPVEEDNTESPHPWLLAGDEKDATRIHGGTGLSPKLLHMIAQITQLSAIMAQDDASIIIPMGARNIEERLVSLRQWSELSTECYDNCTTVEELLQSCKSDEFGLVTTAIEVTDLGAQAWVQAARLYLRFRFHRLPRHHPDVQEPFELLKKILQRLPCSGALFTSQSPFFPVFLYGIAAVSNEDRQIAAHWFLSVVENSSSRSSVPPIWHVLQRAWLILDNDVDFLDDEEVEQKICQRKAWWEMLVHRWTSEQGLLCIV